MRLIGPREVNMTTSSAKSTDEIIKPPGTLSYVAVPRNSVRFVEQNHWLRVLTDWVWPLLWRGLTDCWQCKPSSHPGKIKIKWAVAGDHQLHIPRGPHTWYLKGHDHKYFKGPQNTCGLLGQIPMLLQLSCDGVKLGPAFHNHIVPFESEIQRESIDLFKAAEECDALIVHCLVNFGVWQTGVNKGNHQASLPLQGHWISTECCRAVSARTALKDPKPWGTWGKSYLLRGTANAELFNCLSDSSDVTAEL